MSSLSALLGRTVMDRSNAEKIGKVAAVVLDTTATPARIVAVQIDGAGTEREFVDWRHLTGSGEDAVVVDGGLNLRAATTEGEQRTRNGDTTLLKKRVLTEHGNETGIVADVEFDPGSGEVESVVAGDERIPGDRIRSIGPYALVVSCRHEGPCPG